MPETTDLRSLVEQMGGKIHEESSLTNTETKTEVIPTEPVVTPVAETPVVATNTPNVETQAVTELPKTETPVVVTPVVEPKVETPVAEKKSYKAYDLVTNIDKEFKAVYGISINTAQEIVSVNYDDKDMDERTIVEDYFTAKTEGITDKEIQAKLRKFELLFTPQEDIDKMIEEGKITKQQFDDLDAEWIGLKRESINHLKSVQATAQKMLDEFEVEQEFENKTNDGIGKIFSEKANSFLPTYNNVSVEIVGNDGKVVDTVNFATDEAGKQLVSEIVTDPSNVYKMWMDDKGAIDVQRMLKDVYDIRNRSKIDKAIYDHAHAKGAASIAINQSNIDFSKTNQNTSTGQKALDPNLVKLLDNAMGK